MDYNQNNNDGQFHQTTGAKPESFSIASMTCGVLSVIPCCLGVISIPLGALGILFAVLTRKKGQRLHSMSFMGIWLSCLGLFYGIFTYVHTFLNLPEYLNDPVTLETTNAMSEFLYGQSFEEMLETYYGIQLD